MSDPLSIDSWSVVFPFVAQLFVIAAEEILWSVVGNLTSQNHVRTRKVVLKCSEILNYGKGWWYMGRPVSS